MEHDKSPLRIDNEDGPERESLPLLVAVDLLVLRGLYGLRYRAAEEVGTETGEETLACAVARFEDWGFGGVEVELGGAAMVVVVVVVVV